VHGTRIGGSTLALLWQILSGTGFPNQFFNDSWVVGFWRADHGGMTSNWKEELGRWLKPFLNRLGHKARRQVCPLYVAGLLGPGDRKSVQPMAERVAPGGYDQLHHFVSAGVWDAASLEAELLIQADRLVGAAVPVSGTFLTFYRWRTKTCWPTPHGKTSVGAPARKESSSSFRRRPRAGRRRTTAADQGQGPATSARGRSLAHRRTQVVGREEILSRQPAGKDGPAHPGGHHHGAMGLRAGSSADERRTWSRSLRGPILARPPLSCAFDDDRVCLPPVSPPCNSRTEKKEATGHRRSRLCPPSATPERDGFLLRSLWCSACILRPQDIS
jgi:hypothetical protein